MSTLRDGWILPENVILDVLQAGADDVYARLQGGTLADYLARVFVNETPAKRAELHAWIGQRDQLRVIEGYPLTFAFVPCCCVRLMPEQGSQFVGDQGPLYDFGGGLEAMLSVEMWSTTLGVFVYGRSPEQAKWLYQLAKWWIASARLTLADTLHSLGMRGNELAPAQIEGQVAFNRLLQLTVEYMQCGHVAPTPADDAVTVDGIALPDLGGVSGG